MSDELKPDVLSESKDTPEKKKKTKSVKASVAETVAEAPAEAPVAEAVAEEPAEAPAAEAVAEEPAEASAAEAVAEEAAEAPVAEAVAEEAGAEPFYVEHERRPEMTKWQWTWNEIKKNKTAYFMVAPFLLLFIVFTVIPVFLSILLSFTDFNMLQMPHWRGISNYTRLFLDDEIFLLACKNTLIFACITGPVSYILSLLIAWFINELPPKIRAVVTLVFYAPSISGQVYLVWKTLFSSDSYGWVNATLINLGITSEAILWFEDADYVMGLCIVVALWTSLGTAFLSFIAGFQTIDRSMYEAAAVDGIKNRWQELWYITLPTMRPQLMFGAVLSITNSFGFGAVVTNLCGFPSVDYAAHTIMHHLDDYGGQRYEIGYASAIAVILFIIMFSSNILIKKALSKVGE